MLLVDQAVQWITNMFPLVEESLMAIWRIHIVLRWGRWLSGSCILREYNPTIQKLFNTKKNNVINEYIDIK